MSAKDKGGRRAFKDRRRVRDTDVTVALNDKEVEALDGKRRPKEKRAPCLRRLADLVPEDDGDSDG